MCAIVLRSVFHIIQAENGCLESKSASLSESLSRFFLSIAFHKATDGFEVTSGEMIGEYLTTIRFLRLSIALKQVLVRGTLFSRRGPRGVGRDVLERHAAILTRTRFSEFQRGSAPSRRSVAPFNCRSELLNRSKSRFQGDSSGTKIGRGILK